MNVLAYDAPYMPFNDSNYISLNQGSVSQQLQENQPPLGTQFKSYELNKASNYWTLDPFQYSITKFNYNLPDKPKPEGVIIPSSTFTNDPGLVYKDVNFEKLLPSFTQTKRSVNDFPAQSYHRFEANEGYFNPQEGKDNSDLWYYGAAQNAQNSDAGIAGAPLNVQDVKHIIFPEAQRGGLNSQNLAKYSWSNYKQTPNDSWESINSMNFNNNARCQFFNYNNNKFNNTSAYQFDSNYCRDIGISGKYEGSMPFNPQNVQ